MTSVHDLDRDTLAAELADFPAYRVEQVWNGLYSSYLPVAEIGTLPADLRRRLDETHPAALREATRSVTDDGRTVKYLWHLADGGHPIETVLMYYETRATVCVSTQAGCAMACGFCATGQAGFTRHLTAGEIVEQVVRCAREAKARDRRVDNIVFMGMGEPLANEEAVRISAERIHDDIGISARHLTVSTVGIVPGIAKLSTWRLPVNLAVSLHAARNDLRDSLVPVNRRYPLEMLMEACRDYLAARNRRVTFEWALIDGVNDSTRDAAELARLALSLQPSAHVNLIPLNPTPGWPTKGSPLRRVHGFRDELEHLGVNATVRQNRGTEIAAACGQLAAGQPVVMTRRDAPA
ncbi:MAG: ribosomal large subunit methyltransferase [Actinomycetota bacterium]